MCFWCGYDDVRAWFNAVQLVLHHRCFPKIIILRAAAPFLHKGNERRFLDAAPRRSMLLALDDLRAGTPADIVCAFSYTVLPLYCALTIKKAGRDCAAMQRPTRTPSANGGTTCYPCRPCGPVSIFARRAIRAP
ncbi:hypothetical protein FKP32DRAFT_1595366 [Trametes sanguinea]|nr:hypothetical protein FKP32DRAFT_1595366 [Trametes sanguinea]